MEALTFKSIARYLFAASGIILVFAWMPSPHALLLTVLSILIAIVGLLCGMAAWRWRSALLSVLFQLSLPCLFFIVVLRAWDMLTGWSWVFSLVSLAAVISVGTLPYVNRKLAAVLYQEQTDPQTRLGQWIMRFPLLPVLIVAAASLVLSFSVGTEPFEDAFMALFLALLGLLITLGFVFYIIYRHASMYRHAANPLPGGQTRRDSGTPRKWEPGKRSGRQARTFQSWLAARRAKEYIAQGVEFQDQQEFQSAIEHFTTAIELDPTFLDAYLLRGMAQHELGSLEQALLDLDHVIRNDPDNPVAYYWRGQTHLAMGQADLALTDVSAAIELDPEEPDSRTLRSFIYFQRGEYDAAIEDATASILPPFEEQGYSNRAIILTQMGNAQSAIEDWTRVIVLNPEHASAYCQRGILLEKTGRLERAISDLQTGLNNGQDLPEALKVQAAELLEKLERRNR